MSGLMREDHSSGLFQFLLVQGWISTGTLHWLRELSPQQYTLPSFVMATACLAPTPIVTMSIMPSGTFN